MSAYQSDADDVRAVLAYLNMTGRCSGGRLIVKGHVCLHCGCADPTDPSETCRSPKPKNAAPQ